LWQQRDVASLLCFAGLFGAKPQHVVVDVMDDYYMLWR
jgi:hypothetical protein